MPNLLPLISRAKFLERQGLKSSGRLFNGLWITRKVWDNRAIV